MNYLSDRDLAEFFKNAGYETEMKTVTEWVSTRHNKEQGLKIDKLHVVINGQLKRADRVYQKAMLQRMVQPDPTTIAIVNEILNND